MFSCTFARKKTKNSSEVFTDMTPPPEHMEEIISEVAKVLCILYLSRSTDAHAMAVELI